MATTPNPTAQLPLQTISVSESSPLPEPIVTTARLSIRPMHPQDIPSVAFAQNSPAVARYMSSAFAIPYTLVHATKWIAQNLTPPYNHFAITLLTDPTTVLGQFGFMPGQDTEAHTAVLGYWLGEASWGKGIMTEALEAMTAYGFQEKGYLKLIAKVVAGNAGSERCLKKCGFVVEGVMKKQVLKAGEVNDLIFLGLLKEEWEKRPEAKKNDE
ncbi:acyl-CoA N-acyltransferase [Mytilinidion resinicola]|uniref:Acyl-CoA N-acyltransferase n=1 Tax=Mytilinidion resinicola TaxID=574789 RepID=A0A6A6YZ66_9PEZI|nr:acyl-CoA N-acyltransferase [Mytilinidion resinicola]KAF2814212.1 acyl-CoA N-acyltransferase [Mytilinidion resinicola]